MVKKTKEPLKKEVFEEDPFHGFTVAELVVIKWRLFCYAISRRIDRLKMYF